MSILLTRTHSLRVMVLFFIGYIYLCPAEVNAFNPARCEIDDRFGTRETAILKKACDLAVERLQHKSVRKAVYEEAEYSSLSDTVMRRANATDTSTSRWNLLYRQLLTLSLPNGENDTEPPFPDIFIEYESEGPRSGYRGWLGRAPLDRVTIYWDGKEWKQKGSFYITINDYFVARGKRFSDPNEWAGTIAHEMLHNLGHNHPSINNSNWSKYQINVLDEIIQNFGYGYKGTNGRLFSSPECGTEEK